MHYTNVCLLLSIIRHFCLAPQLIFVITRQINTLFSCFHSSIKHSSFFPFRFCIVSPSPKSDIRNTETDWITVLDEWEIGQKPLSQVALFSGQKCLTNRNLITISWMCLWESIRHFLPKTAMQIHIQSKKKEKKRKRKERRRTENKTPARTLL